VDKKMESCFYCGGNHRSSACLVHSQELTTEAIQNMNKEYAHSSREISDGLSELVDVFSYNHAEHMWELQKQTDVLKDIRNELHDIKVNWGIYRTEFELNIAVDCFKRCDYKESIKHLEKANDIDPRDYRVYITMGHVYLRIDDFKNALNWLEKSIKHAPTAFYESYSQMLIGRIHYCLGDIESAIEKLEIAKELSPDSSEASYQYSTYLAAKLSKQSS